MRTSRARRTAALLAPCVALLIAGAGTALGASAQALAGPSPTPVPAATMTAPAPTRIPPPLKPIDPAAFGATVERAAQELPVPSRG
ncbi:hypothetical protein [Streptomyces vinaceus]|uniref:hypothetical protein n=1 Tax=Streptomyces vinaceus TaxID=1960 RepID=UPI00368F4BF5